MYIDNHDYTTRDPMRKLNLLISFCLFSFALCVSAQTYTERLSRGVVALPAEKGNFISWRFLSTDAPKTTFNLLRNGEIIAKELARETCFTDTLGDATSRYSVQTIVKGSVEETSEEVTPWDKPYLSVPLIRPLEQEMPDGSTCTYTPNDCSAADVDGDGEYEIILKWDPSNSHDNSHTGYTGEVYLDCYKPEGILMWRVSLGKNIRAGAHYTQFMVYDFDGDGKAELICKTAPGSKDGRGDYVTLAATDDEIKNTDNEADYRHRTGHVIDGPEYLTVFAGKDGHAVHTIFYNPNRAFGVGGAPKYASHEWGDNKGIGNRGERYLACVAFLGGKKENPSAVMCRGYYTRAYLWAVDFDGKELKTRWLHKSETPGPDSVFGQGAHSIAVGDVDNDGKDEIIYGAAAVDDDGKTLYNTGLGHGDAQHLGDLDPDRKGLEYYMVYESGQHGSALSDARTGEILFRTYAKEDTGRGISADIDGFHRGSEMWCSGEKKVFAVDGSLIAETRDWTPQNFRIYWDGDLLDELIGNGRIGQRPGSWGNDAFQGPRGQRGQRNGMNRDRQRGQRPPQMGQDTLRSRRMQDWGQMPRRQQNYYVAKWMGDGTQSIFSFSNYGNSASCNGTKATPCLQADLFGDWREEIILYDASDNSHLNIFTTNIPTEYRVVTLMHDHIYRMGICWQNVAYNQPPHLGYYLPSINSTGQ